MTPASISFMAIVLGTAGIAGLIAPRAGFGFLVLFALVALFHVW